MIKSDVNVSCRRHITPSHRNLDRCISPLGLPRVGRTLAPNSRPQRRIAEVGYPRPCRRRVPIGSVGPGFPSVPLARGSRRSRRPGVPVGPAGPGFPSVPPPRGSRRSRRPGVPVGPAGPGFPSVPPPRCRLAIFLTFSFLISLATFLADWWLCLTCFEILNTFCVERAYAGS
jgi:hypothetical protein